MLAVLQMAIDQRGVIGVVIALRISTPLLALPLLSLKTLEIEGVFVQKQVCWMQILQEF